MRIGARGSSSHVMGNENCRSIASAEVVSLTSRIPLFWWLERGIHRFTRRRFRADLDEIRAFLGVPLSSTSYCAISPMLEADQLFEVCIYFGIVQLSSHVLII